MAELIRALVIDDEEQIRYFLSKTLERIGISPERFRVEWISAAEGAKYARVIREMDQRLQALGPEALKAENEAVRPELEKRLRRLPEIPEVAKALEARDRVKVTA